MEISKSNCPMIPFNSSGLYSFIINLSLCSYPTLSKIFLPIIRSSFLLGPKTCGKSTTSASNSSITYLVILLISSVYSSSFLSRLDSLIYLYMSALVFIPINGLALVSTPSLARIDSVLSLGAG